MSDPEEQLDYGDSDNSQERLSFSAGSAGLPSEASAGQGAEGKDQPGDEVFALLLAMLFPVLSTIDGACTSWPAKGWPPSPLLQP